MPYEPHIRLSAIGRLGPTSSGERFQFSINLHRPPQLLDPNADAWSDMADDVAAYFGRPATGITNTAVLEQVKIARIGEDGKYTQDPIIRDRVQAGGGGVNDQRHLPQAALAVSLLTGRRGPTGRGRFYLPMPHGLFNFDDQFRVPAAWADDVAASTATFLQNVANQPGFDVVNMYPCVASSKGYNTEVTGVRVGRVVDTVRSRRTSLPEGYRFSATFDLSS